MSNAKGQDIGSRLTCLLVIAGPSFTVVQGGVEDDAIDWLY